MAKSAVWLTLVLLVTFGCGLVYISGQQILRQNANDPQLQLAEDIAATLAKGKPVSLPTTFTPAVDIATSLAPYAIIYDDHGAPLASTGLLHGKTPSLPPGVLAYTKEQKQDRITWQPETGVRSAIVVTRVYGGQGGYVLVGRSLREIELREQRLFFFAACAWAASILTIGLGYALSKEKRTKR